MEILSKSSGGQVFHQAPTGFLFMSLSPISAHLVSASADY
jgi:hypothetical protein